MINPKPVLTVGLAALILMFVGCREEITPLPLVLVPPTGSLGGGIYQPGPATGEALDCTGLLEDTGALTILSSYRWESGDLEREVFFLEPRHPEENGRVVTLRGAVVEKIGVYGYGIGLSGGEILPLAAEVPGFHLTAEQAVELTGVDLDALSQHPEHNGGYRPSAQAFQDLAWNLIDAASDATGEHFLYAADRLPLPPFADPRLERWLQAYALVNAAGEPERLWVGVRGSFLE